MVSTINRNKFELNNNETFSYEKNLQFHVQNIDLQFTRMFCVILCQFIICAA